MNLRSTSVKISDVASAMPIFMTAPLRAIPLLFCLIAWSAASFAQQGLAPSVQAELLRDKIYAQAKANDADAILVSLDQYHKLAQNSNLAFPVPLLWIEAKAAEEAGDYVRAYDALTGYLNGAQKSDAFFSEALRLYPQLAADPRVKAHIAASEAQAKETASASKTPGNSRYADLISKSASLTPEQRAKARGLFSTAETLWQSGDCSAAEFALRQTLDIDPANAKANFYLGICSQKLKQHTDAMEYMTRASVLGSPDSSEHFKAEVALKELAMPVGIQDMSTDELQNTLVGDWAVDVVWGGKTPFPITIYRTNTGQLDIKGKFGLFGMFSVSGLQVDGPKVHFVANTHPEQYYFSLRLTDHDHMDGEMSGQEAGHASATRKK